MLHDYVLCDCVIDIDGEMYMEKTEWDSSGCLYLLVDGLGTTS